MFEKKNAIFLLTSLLIYLRYANRIEGEIMHVNTYVISTSQKI
jgi:hypothetical protein